jgi:FkbM family methyltransferase
MRRLDGHRDPEHVWAILEKATGEVAYDIGANIGQSTRVLSDGFLIVMAFEPCEESFRILEEEMPRNVETVNMAVSDVTGEVTLTVTDAHIQTGQLTTGEGLQWGTPIGEVTVMSITVDDIANASKNPLPSFIKIDTEGHEVMVLRGAQEVLSTAMPEVLVEVHKPENEQPCRDLLLGYHIEKLEHHYLRPESEIRKAHFWLHGVPYA